ncbi:MAG: hypothetical protein HZR80_09280 [Candidatus Heimdallarchaeota archaeon]
MDSKHNEQVTKVLLQILEKLAEIKLDWVLVGSTNLFVQGVNILAKDIDIVSTQKDILEIEEIFKSYSIKKVVYSESEKYRSWFGRLVIDNIQVDLMADIEYKAPNGVSKKFITIDKYEIPVNPLENELNFYKKLKRKNDVLKIRLIEDFEERKKS